MQKMFKKCLGHVSVCISEPNLKKGIFLANSKLSCIPGRVALVTRVRTIEMLWRELTHSGDGGRGEEKPLSRMRGLATLPPAASGQPMRPSLGVCEPLL